MGWDGSGNIQRTDGTRTGADVWQQALAADEDVNAEDHDAHDEDLADAIERCLNLNGENSPAADVDWGGFKVQNLGNGEARGDAISVGQVQDGTALWAGTTGGTANAQTCSLTPGITAYVAGMRIWVIWNLTTPGALTLNANGVGAVDVLTRAGGNLATGEVTAGLMDQLVFDGTALRLQRGLTRRRLVDASESYALPDGLLSLHTRGVGGGGGGGGVSGSNMAAGGGGAGAMVDHIFKRGDLDATTTITIGAGGAAGADTGGTGGDGGDTIFGTKWTAGGGKGGAGMTGGSSTNGVTGGLGGTVTGTVDIGIPGGRGNVGRADTSGKPMDSNFGGSPAWGLATNGGVGTNGHITGNGYGAGGIGANRVSGSSVGGAGKPGAIELTEEY